jgi:citronellol/citronellal dehydrogenase
MTSLSRRTLFITGGSRGIGRAIALRAARDGANIVIAAKTDQPHPKLPGTIHSVAKEIEAAGGRALPLVLDVRDDDRIEEAIAEAAAYFGGIDILINNASALFLAGTADTPMKRFDLMHTVNVRGTFATTRAALPHLKASPHAHVMVLSPPLDLEPTWFAPHCAYTMSKYGMSMCVLGMAEEFRPDRIAVNALWPQTMIQTAASKAFGLEDAGCRSAEIMADAAYLILKDDPSIRTGGFHIDEDVLRAAGTTDFSYYASVPGTPLAKDLFVR